LKSILKFTTGSQASLLSSAGEVHSVFSPVGLKPKEEHSAVSDGLLQGLSMGRVFLPVQVGFVDGPPADTAEFLFQMFFD
jgi:hypothetical protein